MINEQNESLITNHIENDFDNEIVLEGNEEDALQEIVVEGIVQTDEQQTDEDHNVIEDNVIEDNVIEHNVIEDNVIEDNVTEIVEEISDDCSICLEKIEDRIILICKHQFCSKCVDKLRNHKHFLCPICRGPSIPLTSSEIENGMKLSQKEYKRRMENFFKEYSNYMINKKIIERLAINRRRLREEREQERRARMNMISFATGICAIVCCFLGNMSVS